MATDFTPVSITWQGNRYELILTMSLMDTDYILRKERNLHEMESRPSNIKQKGSLEQCFNNTWSNQLLLNYQFPWQPSESFSSIEKGLLLVPDRDRNEGFAVSMSQELQGL